MKESVINLLINQGYKSYAIVLSGLNLKVDKNILGCTDGKTITIKEGLSNSEISLIVRHEILHGLLSHFDYFQNKELNKKKLNIAGDLELSNFYSKYDCEVTDKLGGLGVHLDKYKKYKGRNIIDIYNDLDEESEDSEEHGSMIDLNNLTQEKKQTLLEEIEKEIEGINEEYIISQVKIERPLSNEEVFINKIKRYFIREEQIQKSKTYKKPNKKYQESNIVVKGNTNKYRPGKTLAVYCDLSGSMSIEKIEKASEVMNGLDRFKRVKKIKKYFSDKVTLDQVGGGGTNYGEVFRDIDNNNYTDVCIVTDNDRCEFMPNKNTLNSAWIIRISCNDTNIEKVINAKELMTLNK